MYSATMSGRDSRIQCLLSFGVVGADDSGGIGMGENMVFCCFGDSGDSIARGSFGLVIAPETIVGGKNLPPEKGVTGSCSGGTTSPKSCNRRFSAAAARMLSLISSRIHEMSLSNSRIRSCQAAGRLSVVGVAERASIIRLPDSSVTADIVSSAARFRLADLPDARRCTEAAAAAGFVVYMSMVVVAGLRAESIRRTKDVQWLCNVSNRRSICCTKSTALWRSLLAFCCRIVWTVAGLRGEQSSATTTSGGCNGAPGSLLRGVANALAAAVLNMPSATYTSVNLRASVVLPVPGSPSMTTCRKWPSKAP